MWIHRTCNNPVRQNSHIVSFGCGDYAETYYWCDRCMQVVENVGKAGDEIRLANQLEIDERSRTWNEMVEKLKGKLNVGIDK